MPENEYINHLDISKKEMDELREAAADRINSPLFPEDINEKRYRHLREELSSISHEIWSHWMKYLFTQCEDDDLGMVIDWDNTRHWQRQMNTLYADLSEREKDSDREQADKIIKVLKKEGVLR